jgi:hypothetical protein
MECLANPVMLNLVQHLTFTMHYLIGVFLILIVSLGQENPCL